MDNNKLLNIIIQVIGCNLLDATPISIPVHILVDTDTTVYLEQDLQDWYQGCKRKMFNTADRILNRIDSPRYFLYGGTNRRKICKNSFIGANIVLFKKTAKLLAVFLVYILFFLSEESFYSEKAVLKSLGLLLYFFSEESSRGRTGDANLHELSDMVVTLIDDNRLVLFCSTHHLLAATLAEVLDEDGEYLALILLVLLGTHLGLQLDKFVEAGYLGFFRNVVWQMLGGIGARAL